MLKCRKLYWERYRKHNLISLVFEKQNVLFYNGKEHMAIGKVRQYHVLAINMESKYVKKKKRWFSEEHNHFEASQCARVVRSAQDGERAAGAKAISGQDPGSRPMRLRVEIAQESENRHKSIIKRLGNYGIL